MYGVTKEDHERPILDDYPQNTSLCVLISELCSQSDRLKKTAVLWHVAQCRLIENRTAQHSVGQTFSYSPPLEPDLSVRTSQVMTRADVPHSCARSPNFDRDAIVYDGHKDPICNKFRTLTTLSLSLYYNFVSLKGSVTNPKPAKLML